MQICGLRPYSKQSLQESLLDAFKFIKVCPVVSDGPTLTAMTQDWLHQGVKQFAFEARIMEMQLLTSAAKQTWLLWLLCRGIQWLESESGNIAGPLSGT